MILVRFGEHQVTFSRAFRGANIQTVKDHWFKTISTNKLRYETIMVLKD